MGTLDVNKGLFLPIIGMFVNIAVAIMFKKSRLMFETGSFKLTGLSPLCLLKNGFFFGCCMLIFIDYGFGHIFPEAFRLKFSLFLTRHNISLETSTTNFIGDLPKDFFPPSLFIIHHDSIIPMSI